MLQVITVVGYLFFAAMISMTDIRRRIIRNQHLLYFGVFTAVSNYSDINLDTLKTLVVVSAILTLLHMLFFKAIGAGDLKLFWVISVWSHSLTNWMQLFSLAWVLGGIFSVSSAMFFRSSKGNIPFAPFILLAFIPSIVA